MAVDGGSTVPSTEADPPVITGSAPVITGSAPVIMAADAPVITGSMPRHTQAGVALGAPPRVTGQVRLSRRPRRSPPVTLGMGWIEPIAAR
jgi:hypothetical protein